MLKIKTVESGYAKVEYNGEIIGTMTRQDFTGFWHGKMLSDYHAGGGSTRKITADLILAMHERFRRG